MELTEKIESLNQQLVDLFGIDSISGIPIWRIVWSEDQFEKRLMNVTDSGILLAKNEVRLVPKYRQWIKEKYVLERLVVVPTINSDELPISKISYEPIFVFEDLHGNYLPPRLDVAKFTIDSIYSVQYENHNLVKYKDPESSTEESIELQRKRVDELVEGMFGNETDVSDSLTRQEGIIVPPSFIRES